MKRRIRVSMIGDGGYGDQWVDALRAAGLSTRRVGGYGVFVARERATRTALRRLARRKRRREGVLEPGMPRWKRAFQRGLRQALKLREQQWWRDGGPEARGARVARSPEAIAELRAKFREIFDRAVGRDVAK